MTRKKVRIKDIAQMAGVSIATASNALSGKRQTNSETAQRIQEIASELGYVARGPGSYEKVVRLIVYKKTGLIIKDTPFFSELFTEIENACSHRGYQLTFTFVDRGSDPGWQDRLNALLEDTAKPTLVLATEMLEEDVAPFRDFRGPLVMLDNVLRFEDINTVSIDNYQAACKAAAALAAQGHARIGLVTSSVEFNNGKDRNQGFRDALANLSLPLRDADVFPVEPTMDGAHRDMLRLLAGRAEPLPTALFAINDITAVSAMRALQERGWRVPEDVSIIGLDNMPFGQITAPALSTLDVSKTLIARLAVKRLVRIAEKHDDDCIKSVVGTRLLLRDSVRAIEG